MVTYILDDFDLSKGARNILLDDGGQLKVAGFGLIKMLKVTPDRYKLTNPMAHIDSKFHSFHAKEYQSGPKVFNRFRRCKSVRIYMLPVLF